MLETEVLNLILKGAQTASRIYSIFPDNTEAEINAVLTDLLAVDPPKIKLQDGVYKDINY